MWDIIFEYYGRWNENDFNTPKTQIKSHKECTKRFVQEKS